MQFKFPGFNIQIKFNGSYLFRFFRLFCIMELVIKHLGFLENWSRFFAIMYDLFPLLRLSPLTDAD